MLDAAFWSTAGAILVLLVMSGFFSGSETALTAASRGKLRASADKGDRGAERALTVTEDRERLIGSVLLGNNLVNILATSLATAMFTRAFGESGVALATLIMTFLVLIFAEVMPKTYAITNAERAASRVAAPISVIVTLLAPVVGAVRLIVRGILRIFGVQTDPDINVLAVREEIAGALHLGHSEGVVEKEDRDRILGALDLADRTVEEVMLHRSGIEMIDAGLPVPNRCGGSGTATYPPGPLFPRGTQNIGSAVLGIQGSAAADAPGCLADGQNSKWRNWWISTSRRRHARHYFIPETRRLTTRRQFLAPPTHFALVGRMKIRHLHGLDSRSRISRRVGPANTDEFEPMRGNDSSRLSTALFGRRRGE